MSTNSKPRLRFAPSPTGIMHLGNIRAALLNYLFAHQKDGTFILRIEDTDPKRNFDVGGKKIMEDLDWLGLQFDEGPGTDSEFAPYLQSQRSNLYEEKLKQLIDKKAIYRCFCTVETLDKKRQRQIALKQPPRYDRACAKLSEEEIQKNLENNIPFIWRFKIDQSQPILFEDLARDTISFDPKNFSDFPITRADGSPTFMFANAVDDAHMKMTHVLRGEDHLTNTVGQVLLYKAFGTPVPIYWHMPILTNTDGKKLSKRDFGFSLDDLKKEGFLPEAITNYLAISGGSYEQEVMDLKELTNAMKFDSISHSGHITYDVHKLRWLNHKWIDRLAIADLAQRCKPFLVAAYPNAKNLSTEQLEKLIGAVQTDITTLKDVVEVLRYYFKGSSIIKTIPDVFTPENIPIIKSIIKNNLEKLNDPQQFTTSIKTEAKTLNIPLKELFSAVRLGLANDIRGQEVTILVDVLGEDESRKRLENIIQSL